MLDYQAGGIAVYWHCFGTEGSHSTLGIPDLVAQQASKRLALCIAAANTQLNPTQPFYARGGTSQSLDDYGGKLRIWCPPPMNPDALAASISVTFTGGLKMALNDDLISTGVSYPMIERRWPSRLLVSGRNFPESVVNYHQETGFSVIDVNPSDGDEIVAIRAFMSVSVYTASQQQQQLLVFKRRSVYSISIDAFVLGQPTYTQQVVTSGHGASTATGIAYADFAVIFASHDGILRLKKDYTLDHLGLQIGRQLKEANFANAALYGGHTDVNAYLTSDNYVWQYIPEYDSWSKWTLPASIGGLCSQNAQMLAAVPGRVYLLDEEGGALDDGVPYRQEVQFRPTHGGDPSILKQGSFIFVNAGMADWEAGSQEQLNVEYATEMLPTWLPCPTATQLGPVTDNDLNSEVTPMRTVLRFGCPAKRFQILQIRAWADRGQRLSLSSVIYKLRLLDQGGAGAGTSG